VLDLECTTARAAGACGVQFTANTREVCRKAIGLAFAHIRPVPPAVYGRATPTDTASGKQVMGRIARQYRQRDM